VFLSGYIPIENMRFREMELNFKVNEAEDSRDLLAAD
jgi:translation initiation factor RLI1